MSSSEEGQERHREREEGRGKREEGSAGSATLDYAGVEEGGVEGGVGGVGRRML